MKVCRDCNINKDFSFFHKLKSTNDGYHLRCKDCRKKRGKKYRSENKEKIAKRKKKYNSENKHIIKKYKLKNKEKIKNYNREYFKKNPHLKIGRRIRTEIKRFYKKDRSTKKMDFGLTPKQFKKWIDWNIELDNLKEYHIDHVRPLASYKCLTYKDFISSGCNHWTNLIPLSPEDNLKKSDREPTKHELFKLELRCYLFKKIEKI